VRGKERAQRFRQKFGKRVGVGEYPDLAGEAAGIGAKVLAQALGLAQDRARVLQQRAAGLGRGHPLPSAHEQRRAQRLFHVTNARAGGSQREMRPRGAARDAPRLDHVAKQAEIGQVEAHQSDLALSHPVAFELDEGKLREIPIVRQVPAHHIRH
jgi:hypothetical protein